MQLNHGFESTTSQPGQTPSQPSRLSQKTQQEGETGQESRPATTQHANHTHRYTHTLYIYTAQRTKAGLIKSTGARQNRRGQSTTPPWWLRTPATARPRKRLREYKEVPSD